MSKLVAQLKIATWVWVGNFSISFGLGYLCSFYLFGVALIPSLIIGTIFTASSLGVAVAPWEERGKLDSDEGQLMIDVAELDDISGVLLMMLLFAMLPTLIGDATNDRALLESLLMFIFSVGCFVSICYLFSQFVEPRISRFLKSNTESPDPLILVVGTMLLISGFSEIIGLSIAIGAFFTGLMYSRDPEAVKIDVSFDKIHALFALFFFVNIGLAFDYEVTLMAAGFGGGFIIVGSFAKIIGNGIPIYFLKYRHAALLIGVSMIPRAEIALNIAEKSRQMEEWAIPNQAFGAVVIMSFDTSLLAPMLVNLQ